MSEVISEAGEKIWKEEVKTDGEASRGSFKSLGPFRLTRGRVPSMVHARKGSFHNTPAH